ncbi:hypothetical protein [Aquimarina intermedia]|uniref:Uncharacterized protein n=1 Tax=Aquimarina intermedia TaxID=350814 RepID=A0A5S5BRZ0_9FLAO|nr:hypothetical protein [Aquimarina intermedia]TYP69684.1 hypothetical protein BD809_1182 [Aquimarina intermedia]
MKSNNHTPIIIGNCKPFRIIVRETDIWNPSLEQINGKDYDYVKLNRMSTFIDIGIAPLSLGIGFDGSLVLPATKEFSNKEDSLAKFNQTLGILLLGGIYSESVQPDNISFGTLFFDGYIKIHGGSSGLVAGFHKSIRNKLVGTMDAIKLLEPNSITITELQDSYKKGELIFEKIKNLSPNMLLDGTSHYVRNQWSESLIFLWTSIEQLVNQIWKTQVIDKEINGIVEGRKDFLKDFRSWTTSTRIEVLFQKGYIPLEVYRLLNFARKTRNDFIHNGKQLNKEKVDNALVGLFNLISLIVSDYKSINELNETLESIQKNQRGELFPKKKVLDNGEVTHWLEVPAIPGDSHWGDKEYEIIDELVLKPLKEGE